MSINSLAALQGALGDVQAWQLVVSELAKFESDEDRPQLIQAGQEGPAFTCNFGNVPAVVIGLDRTGHISEDRAISLLKHKEKRQRKQQQTFEKVLIKRQSCSSTLANLLLQNCRPSSHQVPAVAA